MSPGPFDVGLLPRVASGRRATIWWGVCLLVVIEAIVVLSFVTSYFYLATVRGGAFPRGAPDATWSAIGLALSVVSLAPVHLAERAARLGHLAWMRVALLGALALEAGYVVTSALDAASRDHSWTSHAYGSIVWTISGYQAVHGLIAVCAAGVFVALSFVRRFDGERRAPVQGLRLYWDFVVASTTLVFFTLYVSPHLLGAGR